MEPGKAIVLSEVLKQTLPFKSSFIYRDCDLSRSLVRYHLDAMVGRGFLEKNGMYYSMLNYDALVNEIKNTGEPLRERKLKPTKFFDESRVNDLNKAIDLAVICRILKTPFHKEITEFLINDMTLTIDGFRNAKQYLHRKQYRRLKAAYVLSDNKLQIADTYFPVYASKMSKSKFMAALDEISNVVISEES